MLAACGFFDISQAGLWFYTISVDFELSSLVCVVRNPEALASWNPLGLPMTPFSLLSLTVSRGGGARLTTTTVDSYFLNTSNEALESPWLVRGLHVLCVISWPEMEKPSEGRGVKACRRFSTEVRPLCWAMSRFPSYLTDSLSCRSRDTVCQRYAPIGASCLLGPTFQLCSFYQRTTFGFVDFSLLYVWFFI